ncbi:hypothetical protein HDU79_008431 [Rhizoclosmatium sp. JEL0117]|nr:hypothetical protein HDU79_008431 [Rhizoclosmatium sp. JEL0117]
MNKQPHRTPVKGSTTFASNWRSALKQKCMQRIRESRDLQMSRNRAGLGSGGIMNGDDDNDMDTDTPSGSPRRHIKQLLAQEYGKLNQIVNNRGPAYLDADVAEQLEREMMDELAAYEALHAAQSNAQVVAAEAEAFVAAEEMIVRELVDGQMRQCPACHVGSLSVSGGGGGQGGFSCSVCGLVVTSNVSESVVGWVCKKLG